MPAQISPEVRSANIRQSEKYGLFMERIGWQVLKLPGCQIFIKRVPLLGSIIKIQRPENLPLSQIQKIISKYRALFIKIEPKTLAQAKGLSNSGFKPDSFPLAPTKTLRLNLNLTEEEIFSQFKKDGRYEIKKAGKNGLKIIIERGGSPAKRDDLSGSPISHFISLWHKNAWSRGFWIPLKKQIRALWEAFGQDAYLVFAQSPSDASNLNHLLAGALIIIHDNVAYYFYAASSSEGRGLSAPYLVVWEAIKEAKKRGCQIFDFEGIYDERFPNKSWLGFTHFKKSFGGKEVEYPGSFIKFYNPILNFILKLKNYLIVNSLE